MLSFVVRCFFLQKVLFQKEFMFFHKVRQSQLSKPNSWEIIFFQSFLFFEMRQTCQGFNKIAIKFFCSVFENQFIIEIQLHWYKLLYRKIIANQFGLSPELIVKQSILSLQLIFEYASNVKDTKPKLVSLNNSEINISCYSQQQALSSSTNLQ